MCGYCTQLNSVSYLWQNGRLEPVEESDRYFEESYSLESADMHQLYTLHQQGHPLDAELVLIRLACEPSLGGSEHVKNYLIQAMLNQLNTEKYKDIASSPWLWLDNALSHIFQHGYLPYTDNKAFPAEFTQQLEQALNWAAETIYPRLHVDDENDEDTPKSEQQKQAEHQYNLELAKLFYQRFHHVLLAALLIQTLQPEHSQLAQIALNYNVSFTLMQGSELTLRRLLQYHCVRHHGKDWFWQHLDQLELQHILYLAARCQFTPAEITALQIKLEDEFAGLDYFMTRKDCIDALTRLSLAVEFGFAPDEKNAYY